MEKSPVLRNVEGSRVYYDVLSSKGTFYYTVEMLGMSAISCDCAAGQHGKSCKHKNTAELAEQSFRRQIAPLNSNRAFSLLKN